MSRFFVTLVGFISLQIAYSQQQKIPFQPLDVFELEWAFDFQISPDGKQGKQSVYRRNGNVRNPRFVSQYCK